MVKFCWKEEVWCEGNKVVWGKVVVIWCEEEEEEVCENNWCRCKCEEEEFCWKEVVWWEVVKVKCERWEVKVKYWECLVIMR